MTSNPVADFWAAHLSMPLGRHMTQTYAADIAPGPTYLRIAWDRGEDKDLLRQLAGKYVLFNEQRPDTMYSEATLPDGSKIGGYDHGHFGFSVLSEIVQIWRDDEIAIRAWNLMLKHGALYFLQKNSYLALANNTYGQTGRCRIAGMCLRFLDDMRDAAAFRELQAQKPAVKQRVDAAPKLPNRKTPTAQDRKSQQLESRFKGGKAKLNDLAAFLR